MFKLLIFSSFIVLLSYGVLQIYNYLYRELPLPDYDFDRYWGPGAKKQKEIAIHKIILSYDDEVIDRLTLQLNETNYLTPPLEDVNFEYGFNTDMLKSIVTYWKTDYLSRWYQEREYYIGKYANYQTKIQGLDIHYVHVYPKKVPKTTKVIPIMLIHGWPGGVLEYYDLISELAKITESHSFTFEYIVPYIPGYGFSQAPQKPGFDTVQAGIVFKNLMDRIGIKQYYIHGEDWGAIIGNQMATMFPQHVLGYHSTMCLTSTPIAIVKTFIASFWPSLFIDEKYVDFFYPYMPHIWRFLEENGYMHIQATKPDTVGAALTNNPIGLAAYILEKYSTWTNIENRNKKYGGLNETIAIDKMLDIVMTYYATNSITSSMRFYKETLTNGDMSILDSRKMIVPSACTRFKQDIRHVSDFVLKDKFVNLVQSTYHDVGGHFAAMQVPDVLAKDIFDFVLMIEANKLS